MHTHDYLKEYGLTYQDVKYVDGFGRDYLVSNQGHVFSLKFDKFREMKQSIFNEYGHKKVVLHRAGQQYNRQVHRLVLIAFKKKPPGCDFTRHLDGNGSNNYADNLVWGTRSENERDKIRHGRSNQGTRNGQSKLTLENVRMIKIMLHTGFTQSNIAAKFGVHQVTISKIKKGQRWVHV